MRSQKSQIFKNLGCIVYFSQLLKWHLIFTKLFTDHRNCQKPIKKLLKKCFKVPWLCPTIATTTKMSSPLAVRILSVIKVIFHQSKVFRCFFLPSTPSIHTFLVTTESCCCKLGQGEGGWVSGGSSNHKVIQ